MQLLGVASVRPLVGSAPHRRASCGVDTGTADVAPVTLHLKPVMNTGTTGRQAGRQSVGLQTHAARPSLALFGARVGLGAAHKRQRQAVHQHRRTLSDVHASAHRVDPEPGAGAPALGARGHRGGDGKVGVEGPDAGLVDAEDGKVCGLDFFRVRLVGDRERAAAEVVDARRVELGERLSRAGVVGVGEVARVAAGG